jgi:predicted transglutaminase-like cysteine proteinase
MDGSNKLWWAALGLFSLASTFGAQSIAADTDGREARTFNVLAHLPVAYNSPPFFPAQRALPVAKFEQDTKSEQDVAPVKERAAKPVFQAWPTTARFFTINQVMANANQHKRETTNVRFASISKNLTETDVLPEPSITKQGDEPFGLFTFKAPDGRLTKKWGQIQSETDADATTLKHCATNPDRCSVGEVRFAEMLKHADTLTGTAKIEFINRKVNETIRYTSDTAQWGVPDFWSPPTTADRKGSFDTGLGDCEDYAIAKYVALKASGVSADKLRVLLVRDRTVGMDHAIVAAQQDGQWMLLDNRWDRLLQDAEGKQFMPLFALTDEGVKLIAAPYASLEGAQPAPRRIAAEDAMPSWGQSAKAEPQQSDAPVPFFML